MQRFDYLKDMFLSYKQQYVDKEKLNDGDVIGYITPMAEKHMGEDAEIVKEKAHNAIKKIINDGNVVCFRQYPTLIEDKHIDFESDYKVPYTVEYRYFIKSDKT